MQRNILYLKESFQKVYMDEILPFDTQYCIAMEYKLLFMKLLDEEIMPCQMSMGQRLQILQQCTEILFDPH